MQRRSKWIIIALAVLGLVFGAWGARTFAARPAADPGAAPHAQARVLTNPLVRTAEHSDESPPLRTIRPIPPVFNMQQRSPENEALLKPMTGGGPDTVIQKVFPPLVMPTPQDPPAGNGDDEQITYEQAQEVIDYCKQNQGDQRCQELRGACAQLSPTADKMVTHVCQSLGLPMATGGSVASAPGRRAKMLPMPSMPMSRPASVHQRTNWSRPCRSTSVSVRRRTPPFGVAPMRASSISEAQSRSALICSMAGANFTLKRR